MPNIEHLLQTLPSAFRGPGGTVAVVRDGKILGKHAWGMADIDRRVAMTEETLMPICSISKQMVCAVLKSLERQPTLEMQKQGLDAGAFTAALPALLAMDSAAHPDLAHLCNNQSGIRDYWARSMLWGAHPEGRFTLDEDARHAMARIGETHFAPGAQYAYSNTNFHILARLVETVSGQTLASLLAERIFDPAGMKTALFCSTTAEHPRPCVGHEGDAQQGYVPARNQVQWSGDAGVVASLMDMIAYEQYLHREWTAPSSLYRQLAERPVFNDGNPAPYGNGFAHVDIEGRKTLGHGGALRGYRLHRLHAPDEHLSIIVMLNHQADATALAEHLLRQVLEIGQAEATCLTADSRWTGIYLDPYSKLAISAVVGSDGTLSITYAGFAESLVFETPYRARSREMIAELKGDRIVLYRLEDNQILHADRLPEPAVQESTEELVGVYRCAEIDSTLLCDAAGGVLFGAFEGFLGSGPAHLMHPLGHDTWALKCPRGMDAPAPGDWTLVFERDPDGSIATVTVGCWLARQLKYVRTHSAAPPARY